MRAGRLRYRVTVQRRVESRSGSGAITWTWADWRTVWADVLEARGAKYLAAAQIQAAQDVTIVVRYRTGYRTDQRVRFEHETGEFQTLDIVSIASVRNDPGKLELTCRMREADGLQGVK